MKEKKKTMISENLTLMLKNKKANIDFYMHKI